MLRINKLSVSYGEGLAVDQVSLSVEEGQIVGIVGESGSGKSTMLRSILGLSGGTVTGGEILFQDTDLTGLDRRAMGKIRGKEIAMAFQHPELSLDPLWKLGKTFYESIRVHRRISKQEASAQWRTLCEALELKDSERLEQSYPSQLSGGMCQRAALAIAVANGPKLLLADEPTSALDVTVQTQVMETMMEMREKLGMSILIVSHNIGVIAAMADMVGVMNHGRLVEWGTKEQVLYAPEHEYTKELIRSVPRLDGRLPGTGGAEQ